MWRYLVKFLRRWPNKADLVTTCSSTPTRQALQRIVLLHDETFMQKSWQLSFLPIQQLFESLLLIKWLLLDFSQSFIPTIFVFLEHLFKVLLFYLEAGHVFGKLMAQNPAKVLPGINVLFYSLDDNKQRCSNSIKIPIGFFLELPKSFYLVFNLLNFLVGHFLTYSNDLWCHFVTRAESLIQSGLLRNSVNLVSYTSSHGSLQWIYLFHSIVVLE